MFAQLPENPADWGILFDWDGVVLDSSVQHKLAFERTAEEEGRALPEGWFKLCFGRTNPTIFGEVLGWTQDPDQLRRLADRKEQIYRDILLAGKPEPLPGVRALLAALAEARVPCAIGTATPRQNIVAAIEALGLEGCFHGAATGDDVTRGKPDPQVFLLAAQALKLPPARCVVIEDATYGIEAALRGGMKALAVATTHPITDFPHAHLALPDLTHAPVARLKQLVETGR